MLYDIIVIRYHSFANVLIIYNDVLIIVFNANIIIELLIYRGENVV